MRRSDAALERSENQVSRAERDPSVSRAQRESSSSEARSKSSRAKRAFLRGGRDDRASSAS